MVGLKDEKIIARIPRDASNELIIRTGEYWKLHIVDMRWHINGHPTKKGIRMNMDEMKDVHKALDKIIKMRNDNEFDKIEQDV